MLLIQGVSKPEAKRGATEALHVSLPVGCFRDVRTSEELVGNDLPNDQEALVERDGRKVEHRREDGLCEGGVDVTESHATGLIHVTTCACYRGSCSPHNTQGSLDYSIISIETQKGSGAGPGSHSSTVTGQQKGVSTAGLISSCERGALCWGGEGLMPRS